MATKYWVGTAPAVAQVSAGNIFTVDATPSLNTFSVIMGGMNGAPSVKVSVAGITSATATAAALVAALNASTEPYFSTVTWAVNVNVITATAKVPGVPFNAVLIVENGGTGTVSGFGQVYAPINNVDATPSNNTFAVTLNGSTVSVAGVTSANATVTALVAALNASGLAAIQNFTWSASANFVYGSPKTNAAGLPVISKSGAGTGSVGTFGLVTNNGVVVSSGPSDLGTAANYSDGILPVTSDVLIFENSAAHAVHNMTALAGITLAELRFMPTYTGLVGLDYTNFTTSVDSKTVSSPIRVDYRTVHMQVGATIVNLNSGGQRLNLNLGTVQSTVAIDGTAGSSATNEANRNAAPVRIVCNNASTTVEVRSGTVSFCAEKPGETSTLATINISDQSGKSTVTSGPGITVATIIAQSGTHTIRSNQTIALIRNSGATMTVSGTCAVTQVDSNAGTLLLNNSGGYTTLNGNGGTVNLTGSSVARTGGTTNFNANGFVLIADAAVITFTAVNFKNGLSDRTLTLSVAKVA